MNFGRGFNPYLLARTIARLGKASVEEPRQKDLLALPLVVYLD